LSRVWWWKREGREEMGNGRRKGKHICACMEERGGEVGRLGVDGEGGRGRKMAHLLV
jgi:hypothetical protein